MKQLFKKLFGKKPTIVEEPKTLRIKSTVNPTEPRSFNSWATEIKKELA